MANLDWDRRPQEAAGKRQLALGIVSLVAGIPISAITLEASPTAVPLWLMSADRRRGVGLVGINLAHALPGSPPAPLTRSAGPEDAGPYRRRRTDVSRGLDEQVVRRLGRHLARS